MAKKVDRKTLEGLIEAEELVTEDITSAPTAYTLDDDSGELLETTEPITDLN